MEKDTLQFYPTPPELAQKAWDMFEDKDCARVLEPSAGNGDLLKPYLERRSKDGYGVWHRRASAVDVIEADMSRHEYLKSIGVNVVGYDFLEFKGVARYSHVIMNPPFACGAQHLLHAWEHLFDGEIVCILNAETVRNPFSKERALLSRVIAQHGRVEFHPLAFADAQRPTSVEVALVHLAKRPSSHDLFGDLFGDMQKDKRLDEMSWANNAENQVMLAQGFVEDAVLRFDVAVLAAKEAAIHTARAGYYASAIGMTFSEHNQRQGDGKGRGDGTQVAKRARAAFAQAYDELKDRAWVSILRSTQALSKLSLGAQKRIESEFDQIKALDFTVKNIYGFLVGLCESAGAIQTDMMLEVFDSIARFHEENTVFYMGWKSNGRHRTAGMRLKTTRFILPGFGSESYGRSFYSESLRRLDDIDRVFAMLDGKHPESVKGLRSAFESPVTFSNLRAGERVSTDYFDVRYYPGRGTIHFFPRSKDLMDRLNRMVGKHRQWIPHEKEHASADFHAQYAQAERFDGALRKSFVACGGGGRWSSDLNAVVSAAIHPAHKVDELAMEAMDGALRSVMEANGWSPDPCLGFDEQEVLLLAA